ncbi:MAG: hypothetical protein ABGY41_14910 [Candidatus Poribacteria bacterium]
MAVSRAQLEELVRELPEAEITVAHEAVERLILHDRDSARERRRQRLRDAGLLAHAATGVLSQEFQTYVPPVIEAETLAETVVRNRG